MSFLQKKKKKKVYKNILSYLKEIQTKVYQTKMHPDVAVTLFQIAEQRRIMGEYSKAQKQFEEVLGTIYNTHYLS